MNPKNFAMISRFSYHFFTPDLFFSKNSQESLEIFSLRSLHPIAYHIKVAACWRLNPTEQEPREGVLQGRCGCSCWWLGQRYQLLWCSGVQHRALVILLVMFLLELIPSISFCNPIHAAVGRPISIGLFLSWQLPFSIYIYIFFHRTWILRLTLHFHCGCVNKVRYQEMDFLSSVVDFGNHYWEIIRQIIGRVDEIAGLRGMYERWASLGFDKKFYLAYIIPKKISEWVVSWYLSKSIYSE